ncbi:MAG: calcium/sodium antiporter [Parvularculaceae bacterium]|nr:calcium/sodium antiporter [Parvularculaceae bacterium]
MILDAFLILLGLAVLLVGGDLLVRGAVGLATTMRIPPLLVSLTIIAFGTSAPELVVSVTSVLEHESGIAIGNIIGSNIANVFLVLGLPALIYPMSAHVDGLRRHGVAMLVATAAFVAIAYGYGALDRATGGALFAGIILYVLFLAYMARASRGHDPVIDEVSEYTQGEKSNVGATLLYVLAGLIGLPVGAHLLVDSGSALAAQLGVRPEFIGLTIVAFGTSLPELATVVAAAVHRKSDVAIGNVIGSNIFNIFAVGGAAGLTGVAEFSRPSLTLDIPFMIGAALLLAAYIFFRRDIGRISGLLFLIAYAGFIAMLALGTG